MKKESFYGLVLVVAAVLAYWLCDPMHSSWMPSCPFFRLTGWLCPLCGGQRMMHALLHWRWGEAWHHNAVLLLSLPWCALIVASYVVRRQRPALYDRLLSWRFVMVYLFIAVVWGIVRNIV